MGLLEGAEVELVHEAPVSRDPIAVRARGTLIALRRSEANLVRVALFPEASPA
jgi:ferrous iron transport protein A